jgi:CheY-like chemotaxis protein
VIWQRRVQKPIDCPGHDRPQVLIVDDVAWYRRALCRMLNMECGLRTLEAGDGLRALTLLAEHGADVDIVVCDFRFNGPGGVLQGLQGEEILEEVGKHYPHIKRVMLTAYSTSELQLKTIDQYQVLDKSLDAWLIAEDICKLVSQ